MELEKYIEIAGRRRVPQPTYYFMMNCLLYSRMETGLLSNRDCYDEDVNVYLAHLLTSFMKPDYIEHAKKYLSKYDTEVFKRIANTTDARLKYTVYKTNADFLLVSVGIFENPVTEPDTHPDWKPKEEAYIGRGKTYYHFAYSYSQRLFRKNAGIPEVLGKLSVGFEKYARILSHMRGEYLNLVRRLSKGEVYHLERTISREKQKQDLREKEDSFLDAFSEWKETGSRLALEKLKAIAEEIKKLNPSFHFDGIE